MSDQPTVTYAYLARTLAALIVIVLGLYWVGAYDDHLKKGVEAVRLTLTAKTRVRHGYLRDFRNGGTPSTFIRFLKNAKDDGNQDALWPRMPSGVTLSINDVKGPGDRVLLAADEKDEFLIVEGFRDNAKEPLYSDEIEFAVVFADRADYPNENPLSDDDYFEGEYID